MKRFLVYIVIIMTLSLMTSCGFNDVDEKNDEVTEIEMSRDNQKDEPSEVKTEDVKGGNEDNVIEVTEDFSSDLYFQGELYSIAPSEISNADMERPDDNSEWLKSLKIKYPQLYNMEDTENQKRINELLYKKVVSHHNILENRKYIDYFISYQIMYSNDELFSVLFKGEVSEHQTANSFAFAITINIEDAEEICLEDLFMVNESFIENYLFSKFEVVENNFEDVEENIPYVEQFVESFSSHSHMNDFYIKEEVLGIIIPTYNSMGYMLIEGKN